MNIKQELLHVLGIVENSFVYGEDLDYAEMVAIREHIKNALDMLVDGEAVDIKVNGKVVDNRELN